MGVAPSCCGLAAALTEELVPSSPIQASESASDDLSSCKMESEDDENRYIGALAAEIQEYSHAKDLTAGEDVHAHVVSCGLDSDRYLANLLVLMYGNCGSIQAAEAVFHKIKYPNVYSSNILINAYVNNEDFHNAKIAFGSMPIRSVASWNSIISALARNGFGEDALHYYNSMLEEGFQPNVVTFVSAVDACADTTELGVGMKLHSATAAQGFSSNVILSTALINMYGQGGSLDSARNVFRQVLTHDVLSWSAMIAACVDNGATEEAFEMFDHMHIIGLKPSRSTFLAILKACGNLKDPSKGWKVHVQILLDDIEADIIVENALINMYGLCRRLADGVYIFSKMMQRNIISWSTMVAAHAHNHKNEEALELFHLMQAACGNPNNLTLSIAFDACASLQALEEGQIIHDYSIYAGIQVDFIMVIALINMYGRCNSFEDAKAVFYRYKEPRVTIWNAMISAGVSNGRYKEALRLVEEMQSEGLKPSVATFNIIDGLSVDEG